MLFLVEDHCTSSRHDHPKVDMKVEQEKVVGRSMSQMLGDSFRQSTSADHFEE